MVKLLKGKKNQLAKRQVVILPKLETSECQDMDITILMKRYVEKLESQEGKSKFLSQAAVASRRGEEGTK